MPEADHVTRPPRSRPRLLALVLVILAVAGGCALGRAGQVTQDTSRPVVGATEVSAKNLKFRPPAVQVPAGTTVTWHFDDGRVPHDVTFDGFASKQQTSGTFSHRFDQPGSYPYKCTLHVGMVGRVVVVPR